MKLSICMIVKNEEKNLDRCLISLIPLTKAVDSELIIVDTGSTDNTVEIAKKYTDKVHFHAWNNNFADMRNISFSYAKGKWIMFIDADEEIEDSKGIVDFFNKKDIKGFDSAAITIKNLITDEESGCNYQTGVRLFKNTENFKFVGAIHEHAQHFSNCADIPTVFIHYGYLSTDTSLMEQKFIRNIVLLKEEIIKNPDNIQIRIYASNQYFAHEDYKEALDEILVAYKIMKDKKVDPKNCLFLYPRLVFCYMKSNMLPQAEKMCLEGIGVSDEHIDLHFCLAKIKAVNGEYVAAIYHFNKFLNLVQNFDNLSIRLTGNSNFSTLTCSEEVYLDLASIYAGIGKYNIALDHVDKAVLKDYIDRAFAMYILYSLQAKLYSRLANFYTQVVLKNSNDKINLFTNSLEQINEKLPDSEKLQLYKAFANDKSEYGCLNKKRITQC